MTTASVAASQRHTRANRCPICDGADGDPRGKERRCSGFASADGDYVHCSREELAGSIDANGAGLFAHRMQGSCHCGTTHGPDLRTSSNGATDIEATYDYRDENGALVFQVVRKFGKQFRQRKPDGAGGWEWKLNGVRRVPYLLPELLAADPALDVYITEGEKDADSLSAKGLIATCNPGGAGKWSFISDTARKVLAGRNVVVVGDNDDAGRAHVADVAGRLRDVVRSIRVLVPPAPHKDVSDLLAAGGMLDELIPLSNACDPDEEPEEPAPSENDQRNASDNAKNSYTPTRHGLSPADVVATWRKHGPIERLATGWATFDRDSRGGLIFGHCTYFLGAPNAKKTAALACLADAWTRDGVAVGALLVDETPEDFLIRFAVRAGFSLDDCETRDPRLLSEIDATLADLPLRLYGAEWTIEAAARDFAGFVALVPGRRAAFLADTIQTIACEDALQLRADSPRALVNANVKALHTLATSTRWVVAATSEMNRNAYRSEDAAERSSDMAAGKESGAIEYAAKAQLVFRSVKGRADLVQVKAPKIKRGMNDESEFCLTFERHQHTLSECAAPAQTSSEAGREGANVAKGLRQVKADAKVVAGIVLATPGIGERVLRAKLKAGGHAWGRDRLAAAKEHLGRRLANRGDNARDIRWHLVSEPTEEGRRDADDDE